MSKCGVRQGDPLGPLLFCVGLNSVLSEFSFNFTEVNIAAYMDDITLCGPAELMTEALDWLEVKLRNIGLNLNHLKTKSYGMPVDNVPHNHGGLKVLGCPIGSDLYADQILADLFQSMNTSISKVKKLSPQFAIPILRYCVSSKANYFLRLVHPIHTRRHVEQFDSEVLKVIEYIVGCPLEAINRKVCRLPVREGGLGIPQQAEIAERAWTASFATFYRSASGLSFISLPQHFKDTLYKMAPDIENPNLDLDSISQKSLTMRMHSQNLEDLQNQLKNEYPRKSIFNAQRCHQAPWLNQAFFGRFNKLSQSSAEFQISLKLRLLLAVQETNLKHCSCRKNRNGTHVDLTSTSHFLHGLTCPDMSGSIISRHDRITKLLESYALKIEDVSTRWNKTTYNMSNPENHHRADLYVKIPEEDEIIIDTKILNIAAPTYYRKSTEINLKNGENQKCQVYRKTLGAAVVDSDRFVPFVLDITGNIGKRGKNFIEKLAKLAKDCYPQFKAHITRDISLLMAREVSDSILNFNFRRRASSRVVSISNPANATSSSAAPIGSSTDAAIVFPPTRGNRWSTESVSSISKKPDTSKIVATRNGGKGKHGLNKPKST